MRYLQVSLACLLWVISSISFAVEFPSGPGDRELQRQQQEQLLQDQAEKLRQLQQLPDKELPPEAVPAQDDRCFPVMSIDLQGVVSLSEDEINNLIAPWLNTCVGVSQINQIIREISNLYHEKGFVTARAYIPEQDLSSGTLIVLVVEGEVSGFKPDASSGLSDSEVFTAFPDLIGQPLNIRDLEQGIDQINRLPSNSSQLKLMPGSAPGESIVDIANVQSKPWRASLAKHNNGDESTGDKQWQGSFEWDNPLKLNDQIAIFLSKDAVSDNNRQSHSATAAYSIPYGYWNFSYNFNYSDYTSRSFAVGFPFELTGNTRNHTLNISRVLHRDQLSKTAFSINTRHIRTRNYIEDNLIDINSHKLTQVSLGLNHGRRLWNGFLNLDGTFDKGVRLFGAQDDSGSRSGFPRAQYQKYTATVSYFLPVNMWNQNFSYTTLATGQWGDDVLYSPLRISVGGLSSVRGFRKQSLSGDSGGYWRNDATWKVPVRLAGFEQLVDSLSLGVAYDAGVIHRGKYNPELSGRLSSRAFVVKLNGKYLGASVTFAETLSKPNNLFKKEHPVWFRLDLKV